jgi:hypothetical protein
VRARQKHTGRVLRGALRRCLLSKEKLASELRSRGFASWRSVRAVVLEPTGQFLVITDGERAVAVRARARRKRACPPAHAPTRAPPPARLPAARLAHLQTPRATPTGA